MDAERLGDPKCNAGVATGRLPDKVRDIGGDVPTRAKEIGVNDHLLGPLGDAGIESLRDGRLPQLHVRVMYDVQAKTLPHHPGELLQEIVRFLSAAAVIDDEKGPLQWIPPFLRKKPPPCPSLD